VRVRRFPDRLEVSLGRGFTGKDLAVVKSVPGRRWEAAEKVWILPGPENALARLTEGFGPDRLLIESSGVPELGGEAADLMEEVRKALLLRGYSRRTQKLYLGHLRRFFEWLVKETAPSTAHLRGENAQRLAQAYLVALFGGRRLSKSYHNQVVSALRFLFETVLEEPRLGLSLPRPRMRRHLPAVLSVDEVARLLAKPRNLRDRTIVTLLYSSGLRVGELTRLRPKDVDEERGVLTVRNGKGGKDRQTILGDRARETVRIYRAAYAPGRWLFESSRPDRHIHPRSVQRLVAEAARAAGIEKKVTPHTLRHSFATHLLESGTNIRVIQELLGHKSTRTTQIYTHVARSTLESVRSPMDDLPEE
jgi:site-specific recombinase XerD